MANKIILSSVGVAVIVLVSIYLLTKQTKIPPRTVEYVDLDRYLGVWYEQSSIPAWFSRNCQGGTRANYTRNPDNTIKVDNKCYQNGVLSGAIGKAYPNPDDQTKSNSKLIVQFSWVPFAKGDYWIVRLDKDYKYVVVGSPDYAYMWILSREKKMQQALYDEIIADLKKDNFPVE